MEENNESINQIELKSFLSYFIAYFKDPILFLKEFKYFNNRFVFIFLIILYGNFGFIFYSYTSNTFLILIGGFLYGGIRYIIGITMDIICLRLSGLKKGFDIEIIKKTFLLYSPLLTVPYTIMILGNNLMNDTIYTLGNMKIDLWIYPFSFLWIGYTYYILRKSFYDKTNKYMFNFLFLILPIGLTTIPFIK